MQRRMQKEENKVKYYFKLVSAIVWISGRCKVFQTTPTWKSQRTIQTVSIMGIFIFFRMEK
jgi:hypothetical protein